MNQKKINKMKLLATFSLATLIFLVGIIFGNYVSNKKIGVIQDIEQDLRTDTVAAETQYLLLTQSPCRDVDTTPLTEELYQLGSKISYMENQLGEKNKEVIRLKEYYSILEIKHWLLLKKIQTDCKQDYNLILYFYSSKEACPNCEQQGFILNYIKKKHENTKIYSFDINNKNSALNTLKVMYNITGTPSLVINDISSLGFKETVEIEKRLIV
jgi:hypothetical protein